MSAHKNDGLIVLFVGPSGAGKDTLSNRITAEDDLLKYIVTATTRDMRDNEVDGVNYHFMSQEEFERRLDENEFLEWNRYHGNYYGALKEELLNKIEEGYNPHTDITWSGARAIRDYRPKETVLFLILPPSIEELDRRLAKRIEKTGEDDAQMKVRTEKIRTDIQHWREKGYEFTNEDMIGSRLKDYDYVIINDNLDAALHDIRCAIHAERLKRAVK